ncbi:MAG: lipocalin-like domain-containing protein [Myxococcota bacterium]
MSGIRETLIGSWELLSFEVESDAGVAHPYGESGRGRIVYTASGHMSAVLSRSDRPALSAGSLEAARGAEATDKARAFDDYLSYSGRWRLEERGDELWVHHTVDLALVPEVVGTTLERRARFEDDVLVLDYENRSRSGRQRRFVLRWKKEKDDSP